MPLNDVLDDRQTKSGAAGFAASGWVDAIEALRDARQMLARDSGAVIGDADQHPGSAPLGRDID